MDLEAYSDEHGRSCPRSECECGNPKTPNSEACKRCTYLDGNTGSAYIIAALRGSNGMTIRELCEVLGLRYESGRGNAGVLRTCQRLERRGRVRRYWREIDQHDVVRRVFGHRRQRTHAGGSGCWVYVLTEAS